MDAEHKERMRQGRARARRNPKFRIPDGLESTISEKVARRAAIIPPRFKQDYLKAMQGKSLRAGVNAFCRECVGWEDLPFSVRNCTAPACPLYLYRPYQEKIAVLA